MKVNYYAQEVREEDIEKRILKSQDPIEGSI